MPMYNFSNIIYSLILDKGMMKEWNFVRDFQCPTNNKLKQHKQRKLHPKCYNSGEWNFLTFGMTFLSCGLFLRIILIWTCMVIWWLLLSYSLLTTSIKVNELNSSSGDVLVMFQSYHIEREIAVDIITIIEIFVVLITIASCFEI